MVRTTIRAVIWAAIIGVCTVAPASAEGVDVSTITCKEMIDTMLKAGGQNTGKAKKAAAKSSGAEEDKAAQKMGVLLVWLNGHNASEDCGMVIDFQHLGSYVEKLSDYCLKNPKIGLMTAAEKFTGDNMPKPSKKAVDVSVLKCNSITAEPDEETSLSIIWLAGWHAALNNETTFDLDEFQNKMGKFGEFCAANPTKGFNTAAKAVFTE